MFWVWSFLIGFGSFAVGAFAFPQIIGSIRIAKYRTVTSTIFTVVLWLIIIVAVTVLVSSFLSKYKIFSYIGLAISLVMSWRTGKNGPEN